MVLLATIRYNIYSTCPHFVVQCYIKCNSFTVQQQLIYTLNTETYLWTIKVLKIKQCTPYIQLFLLLTEWNSTQCSLSDGTCFLYFCSLKNTFCFFNFIKHVTNSTVQVFLGQYIADQLIKKFAVLWNLKIHYHVHKIPQLDHILNKMNYIHTFLLFL